MTRTLGFELDLPLSFDAAIERVTAALAEEGFGVLTRVDIHQAFKKKLDGAEKNLVADQARLAQLTAEAITGRRTPDIIREFMSKVQVRIV